jgi:hypothetical protein
MARIDIHQWENIYMKKTFNVDEALPKEAKSACAAATDTEIRPGLEALVRHAAYQRLRALRGWEPLAEDVPRRGENPLVQLRD